MTAKTTAEAKIIRGTRRADRERTRAAPDSLNYVPEPPSRLSQSARSEWAALAPLLVNRGSLSETDLRSFERLCAMLAEESALVSTLAEDGIFVKGAGSTMKAHPALRALESVRAQIAPLSDRFGLSPRARQAVAANPSASSKDSAPLPSDAENPLAKFLIPYKVGDPWPPRPAKPKKQRK